jgi:two-component system, LytTR family, sensor kinase
MESSVLIADASTVPPHAAAGGLPKIARSRVRDAVAVFVAWAVFAVISALFSSVNRSHMNAPPEWGRTLALNLLSSEICSGPTFFFLWAVRRWPIGPGRWRYAFLYLASLPVLVALMFVAYLPVRLWLFPTPFDQIRPRLAEFFYYDCFMLILVLGMVHAVEYQRSMRESQLRVSELKSSLTHARLEVLRNELQPHFLFNALHSISTLMHRNVEAADEMIAQLGDLLRLSLERKSVQEAPLREELAVLAPYLSILRIRFGDRLSIGVDVDPTLLEATVPLFLLQPLVENAIRHGIDRRAGAGRIEIRARSVDDSIEIRVADDGAGLTQNGFREGIGLSNIRLRLEQLYGARGSMSLNGNPDSGTEVAVKIPRQMSR